MERPVPGAENPRLDQRRPAPAASVTSDHERLRSGGCSNEEETRASGEGEPREVPGGAAYGRLVRRKANESYAQWPHRCAPEESNPAESRTKQGRPRTWRHTDGLCVGKPTRAMHSGRTDATPEVWNLRNPIHKKREPKSRKGKSRTTSTKTQTSPQRARNGSREVKRQSRTFGAKSRH